MKKKKATKIYFAKINDEILCVTKLDTKAKKQKYKEVVQFIDQLKDTSNKKPVFDKKTKRWKLI